MKKKTLSFIFKCILALLPVILFIGFTYLFPMAYMDIEYPAFAYTKNLCRAPSSDSASGKQLLILGDSRAMADIIPNEVISGLLEEAPSDAYDFSELNIENLAFGGATSIEMYYTLKNYLKHHEAPERIIVMFAPFHYSYMDNFWQRTMYFNYLSISEVLEVYDLAKELGSETVLTESFITDSIGYRFRMPDKYLPAIINAKGVMRYPENKRRYDSLESEHGFGSFGTAAGSSDASYEVNYTTVKNGNDSVLLLTYMKKLLSLCDEQNIPVLLLQPPMNEASFTQLNEEYLKEYQELLKHLSDSCQNAIIEDDIPCYENRYFGDASHLNREGAIVYSKELVKKILRFIKI